MHFLYPITRYFVCIIFLLKCQIICMEPVDVNNDVMHTIITCVMTPYINNCTLHEGYDDDKEVSTKLHNFLVLHRNTHHLRQVCKAWNNIFFTYIKPSYTTLLRQAIVHGQSQIAQHALNKGADINSPCRIGDQHLSFLNGVTPLFYAAYQADVPMVKNLLSQGALIKLCDTPNKKVFELIKHAQKDNENPNNFSYQMIYTSLTTHTKTITSQLY